MTSASLTNAVVELRDVAVVFKDSTALDIPRLDIGSGERLFVLGRSGSGKTTLSRLIKSRIRPRRGTVRVLGEPLEKLSRSERIRLQRRIAMIDQEFHLVPRMSVVGNVLCGALGRVRGWKSLLGMYPTHEWEKAEAILKEVELDGLGERRVETLSGGQRQRVAIARALMQEADIIVADEPVSNLDPELAEDSLELLVRVTERRDVTLLVNLHQPRLAKQFATRVLGLHQGRIVYDGSPDALSTESEELIYRAADSTTRGAEDGERFNDRAAASLA